MPAHDTGFDLPECEPLNETWTLKQGIPRPKTADVCSVCKKPGKPEYLVDGQYGVFQCGDCYRHANKDRYPCSFTGCSKAFYCASKLAAHELTHTGEKPHKCDYPGCDAAYTRSDKLAQHKKTKHG